MMGFTSVSDVLLLLALAAGYIVFYLAKREAEIPRLIGYAISAIIIGASIAYMLSNAWMQSKVFEAKMRCYQNMMGPGMMRPGMMRPGAPHAMPRMSPRMPMRK
jgi:hypothetical protein